MSSTSGHCEAVLAPDAADFGVGITPGGAPLWTQLFGLQSDREPPSFDTVPAAGCPFDRLAIAPGPARITIHQISRGPRVVLAFGRLEPDGAGRRILVNARHGGRTTRASTTTDWTSSFRARVRPPRGRGRVTVTFVAPAVTDVYKTGRVTRRI